MKRIYHYKPVYSPGISQHFSGREKSSIFRIFPDMLLSSVISICILFSLMAMYGPQCRIDEALRDGLDAIAITDHHGI